MTGYEIKATDWVCVFSIQKYAGSLYYKRLSTATYAAVDSQQADLLKQ